MLCLAALAGLLKGVCDDALAASPREHARLNANLFVESPVLKAAHFGVLALGVFADDQHIDVIRLPIAERRCDAGVQHAGPLANILVECAPYWKQKPVQREMVLDVGMPHRPEVDGVGLRHLVKPVGRHHRAMLEVVVRTPGMFHEIPANAVLRAHDVQHADALFNHFAADAVAANHGYSVLCHNALRFPALSSK